MDTMLAQFDPNLISLTGVIFTVLAVIFGIGAYTNSRNRKRHLRELDNAQRQEQQMHFRPAQSKRPNRSAVPARSSRPGKSTSSPRESSARASTPRAAPVAKSSTKAVKESQKDESEKPVLFRKVRPDGNPQSDSKDTGKVEENYSWE